MANAPINSKLEFTICKETANLAVTAGELIAIYQTLRLEIGNPAFLSRLDRIMAQLLDCYRIPLDALQPLLELDSPDAFQREFTAVYDVYRDQFLQYASQPRRYVDEAYAQYLELSMMREATTSYPLLKRTFDRLFQFIDKWINNDSWLIMSMDTLFKMLNRLLGEVASLKASDPDEAWWMYHSFVAALRPLHDVIRQHVAVMETLRGDVAVDHPDAAA